MKSKYCYSKIAEAFCDECRSAYESWVVCRVVFDDLPANASLMNAVATEAPIDHCINRMFRMCHEAWIGQVVRLHDPAEQGHRKPPYQNLSIKRIRELEGWTKADYKCFDKIVARLTPLQEKLKEARNKDVSHIDLETRLGNARLGLFCPGEDNDYFRALAELAELVWNRWIQTSTEAPGPKQVFDFSLDALADDVLSIRYQAQLFRDWLCAGLRAHHEPEP